LVTSFFCCLCFDATAAATNKIAVYLMACHLLPQNGGGNSAPRGVARLLLKAQPQKPKLNSRATMPMSKIALRQNGHEISFYFWPKLLAAKSQRGWKIEGGSGDNFIITQCFPD